MPRVRLTDMSISKFPHSRGRVTYWDEGLPAFGVRVGARRKTFIVILNGGRRIKLGNYPFTSLKEGPDSQVLQILRGKDFVRANNEEYSVLRLIAQQLKMLQ